MANGQAALLVAGTRLSALLLVGATPRWAISGDPTFSLHIRHTASKRLVSIGFRLGRFLAERLVGASGFVALDGRRSDIVANIAASHHVWFLANVLIPMLLVLWLSYSLRIKHHCGGLLHCLSLPSS